MKQLLYMHSNEYSFVFMSNADRADNALQSFTLS